MNEECLFRGKWKKEFKTQIYGCSYYNKSGSLSFLAECPHKNIDVRRCELFKERDNDKRSEDYERDYKYERG